MLKYIISIVLTGIFWSVSAQWDSLPPAERPGIRLAYDIGKKAWSVYRGGNIDDIRLTLQYRDHRLDMTFGRENMPYEHEWYRLQADGYYWKAGYAYNFFENWGDMRNDVTLGMAVAKARFDYRLLSYTRLPLTPVFDPVTVETDEYYPGLSAFWLEVTSAVRAELWKGLFLELHVSGKYMLRGSGDDRVGLVYVPGFYTTNISRFGFGLGYKISYLISF